MDALAARLGIRVTAEIDVVIVSSKSGMSKGNSEEGGDSAVHGLMDGNKERLPLALPRANMLYHKKHPLI